MPLDPALHHRRSIRLRGYDYAQPGEYCLAICTRGRRHLFGEIVEGEMVLNPAGKMVEHRWSILTRQFSSIRVDEFAVMPNHLDGIIVVVRAPLVGVQCSPKSCARPLWLPTRA
jgi:putative transposase